MGGPHNEHQVELKKLLFRHPPQKRSNNYNKCDSFEGVAIQKVIVRRSLTHARLISRFYEIQVGAFISVGANGTELKLKGSCHRP
jgi:hypothetical protein